MSIPVSRWEFRRNCSASPRTLMLAFASVAAVSLGIGLVFASLGAWLVLPFVGLEIAALAMAFVWCCRHAGDREMLALDSDGLTLTCAIGARQDRHLFNPLWTRVELETGRTPEHARVYLRGHGRRIEVGRFLTGARRAALAADLRAALGSLERARPNLSITEAAQAALGHR